MLPDISILLPYTLAVIVIAITPGPDMTFFVSRTLAQGRLAGFVAALGTATGILLHSALVALGLSALIVAAPKAFLALKIIGALYLLWLAFDAIRNGSALTLPGRAVKHKSMRMTWAQGFLINVLNPKVALFFMTFLPQFVSPGDPHAPAKLFTLGLLFIAIFTPIMAGIVLTADKVAETLRAQPFVTRVLDWLFASVFAGFAAHLLLSRAR